MYKVLASSNYKNEFNVLLWEGFNLEKALEVLQENINDFNSVSIVKDGYYDIE